jgi:amino acid transporter/nucleotide-binding universal stress UspA family protein
VYWIGVSLFLGYTGTTAFYLATMDEWFFRFILPEWLAWLPHGTTGVAAALLLGTLNARGTEESGTFQLIVSGAKVAVLFAFIGGAFAYRGPTTAAANFATQFSTDVISIFSVAALAFITFFGFSAIAASAGEIIEPRKTVPRAIAASIVTVTILYALVIVAMTNSTVPPEVIAEQGETAMGSVAAGFLGPIGQSLIVAGAVFSMVSASNASILAASSIGSLMGRQGQAPRSFARIHREYNTPFWSVMTATATIVTLIVAFMAVFPHEGGFLGLNLGLTALTGFATLNLLLPLAVVNAALIYHRRRFPEMERGFRVPGVPVVPALGILANLALIYNLPRSGVATGVVIILGMLGAYLLWGGAADIEDLVREVQPAESGVPAAGGSRASTDEAAPATANGGDRYRVLVPVARPSNAPAYMRLAEQLAVGHERPLVQIVTVTQVPEQTPYEVVSDTAGKRADRIRDVLAEDDHPVEYTIEAHTSRDVGFDIVQTARNEGSDLIVMGYPKVHVAITEKVEYDAPCDIVFASEFAGGSIEAVNIGAGGGPHHQAAVRLVDALGQQGVSVNVISVDPAGEGTSEDAADTVAMLSDRETATVQEPTAATVADGLVEQAAENGGILVIGASRDRRLRQWVFGSTPDRVVNLAEGAGVPVLVSASSTGVRGGIEDYLFPVYRYVSKRFTRRGTNPDYSTTDQ